MTAVLFMLLLIGAVVGVGAVAMGQVRAGLCNEQPLRVVAALGGGGFLLAAILMALLALINLELFERSLGGVQIVAVGLVTMVVGFGLATFYTVRAARQSCPRLDLSQELAQICQGRGLAAAAVGPGAPAAGIAQAGAGSLSRAAAQNSALSLQRLVVLGEGGETIPWSALAEAEWKPENLAQVELVVCVGPSQQEIIETCKFGGGINIKRERETVALRLLAAQSGQTLASDLLTAEPPACKPMGLQDLPRLHARLYYEDLKDWLAGLGSGESVPGVTPSPTPRPPTVTPSPAPSSTPSPSPTPQLMGEVTTGARLRAGPSKNDSIIGGLSQGDIVTVLGANSDWSWLKVITPAGETGWIFSKLVLLPVPYLDVPQVP